MMEPNIWHILLIDDDEEDYLITRQMLSESREGKFLLEWVSSFQTGQAALEADSVDAVLVDYDLGARTGIELIREAVACGYPAPILLLTGRGTYEVDVEAMAAGAADYLCKGEMNAAFLERAIRYAIERKKHELALRSSETQLRESKERYQQLFTTMLNGFALHEMLYDAGGKPVDYRFLEVNPAFEQLTGLNGPEIVGKTVREILPGIDSSWIDTYGKVVLTGEPVQFENYASPLEKHFQVYAFRPRTHQFATIFSDITERKQAEETLRERQSDLAHAQAVSHTGSWRLDLKLTALIWSDETYRIFDLPIGTPLTYESFLAMVHPADREFVDQSWTSALHGAPYDIEHRILAGDQVKWVHERAVLEFDGQGILRGGFGAVQDVTEHKIAEAALRESERRFRIALANPALAVFSTDCELRYTWFYSTAMSALSESFIGKRDDEILSPANADGLLELKQQAIETRAAVQGEILLNYGPQARNLIVAVEPYFGPSGNLEGVIGAFFDLTEQRRLEAESIEHITQMEVHHRLLEYREKERQGIARDLHDGPVQDLSGLMFNLQVLREAIHDPVLQVEFEQIGGTLKQTIQDLRSMINELRPPSLIRFGVIKAIHHYTQDFCEKHPELEIQLDLQPPDNETHLSEQVNLTLFRIYQEALNNILRHAQATQIWVRFRQLREYVILEVRDNGIGFPRSVNLYQHTQDHHFGLAGMKERADAVGGEFTLASQPGQGTSIHVTIPLIG